MPVLTRAAGWMAACLPLLLGCSEPNSGDPFTYQKVSGTLSYEDGSKIPTQEIYIRFYSEAPPVGSTYPRAGTVVVDGKSGEFHDVTSHTPNDGLVQGKHKVTITGDDNKPLPANIVPAEYADVKRTPLEVDTGQQPFVLKVRKPQLHESPDGETLPASPKETAQVPTLSHGDASPASPKGTAAAERAAR
jgi:hypothetical protein